MDSVIFLSARHGLGDAIYLRAIALNFLARGESVAVSTHWQQIFTGIPVKIGLDDGTYRGVGFSLHHKLSGVYSHLSGLDQFRLCAARAGIPDAEFDIKWPRPNSSLCRKVIQRAGDRKILMYQPRKIQNELSPKRKHFEEWLRSQDQCFRIRVGSSKFVESEPMPCEMDLFDRATVEEVFDVATLCDTFFGEPCFVGILADALGKENICMLPKDLPEDWNHVTAERMFHRPAKVLWTA